MSSHVTYAKQAMQSIDDSKLCEVLGHLCEAIKELQDETDHLKSEIKVMSARVTAVEPNLKR